MYGIKKALSYLMGRVFLDDLYTPSEKDFNIENPILLHISDTPSMFFSELSRIIKKINPEIIVHTGDLVDNIKLQMQPGAIRYYEREVLSLLKILEYSAAKIIHISLGNHDSHSYIHQKSGRIIVHDSYGEITAYGKSIVFSHYLHVIESFNSNYYLYGHDLSTPLQLKKNTCYLNGITSIHLIDLITGGVLKLEYPWGVDDARLNKRSIGI
ncbi:metallophosphoesterase [Fusibacter bizertensis]|uniref:Metallophosphoesterase n=1 Tax=Fusibacter bizertensis TaxID=1488331 RepID=A0ABT6NBR1_9FIRM|nr:metallophosphoesterase [Fusibacter bizertensis]MDH8677857.1 metallophosphoesterase [Fusibacter bizertensis]